MKAFRLTGGRPRLVQAQLPEPRPGPGQVAVRVVAASLNYRDLLMARSNAGRIPLSDGAGEICEIGAGVDRELGERVAIAFSPVWRDGPFSEAILAAALGGAETDGVLAERVVVPAGGLVSIPSDMSFEEAACLPCAGVTAWTALFERRPLLPGETVLLLGTGGVSIFALQLAKRAGARVIVTSSSNEKLERARALGADETINYRVNTDWAAEVLRLTGGKGVDLAVEVGGPETLNATLRSVRFDGRISLMGVLTGVAGQIDTVTLMRRRITLQGIYVGPVSALEAVVRTRVRPAVDHVYPFDAAEEAFDALAAARHFGKLAISVAT